MHNLSLERRGWCVDAVLQKTASVEAEGVLFCEGLRIRFLLAEAVEDRE